MRGKGDLPVLKQIPKSIGGVGAAAPLPSFESATGHNYAYDYD